MFNIYRLEVKTNNEIDEFIKKSQTFTINQYKLELNDDDDKIENLNFVEIYSPCNSWNRDKIDFTTCINFL